MSEVIRVTVPGSDVFTETNPNNFSLRSDDSTILIKEKARGSVSLGYTVSTNIAHGLGYIPACLVWGDDVNGNLIYGGITNIFSASNEWEVTINNTNVNILQAVDNSTRTALYYIFYDQVG